MNRWLLPLALAASLLMGADLAAHGGTYRGPGDTVPPAGGGAATPTVPTTPTSPATPSTPSTPSTPNAPSTPQTPGVVAPPSSQPHQAVTQGTDSGPDLTTWEFWWEFNKEPYLNLKAKIHSGSISTGESELLVGLSDVSTSNNNTFAPSNQQITGIILPALSRVLQNESNQDILSSALIGIAKIGRSDRTAGLLKPFLHHPNQEIAETAALSYGILQYEPALGELKDMAMDTPVGRKLVDKDSGVPLRTRTFAAYGMALVAYASEDPELRSQIADSLWTLLESDDSALKDIRVACVIGLGLCRLDDPSGMVGQLEGLLGDESRDYLVRAHCPNAIAKLLMQANAAPALADAAADQFLALLQAKNTKVEIRQSCIQALGMLGGNLSQAKVSTVVDKMIQVQKKGKDRQEKNFTAISLAYLGAEVSAVRDTTLRFLLENVKSGSTAYRPWAALALGVMAFKSAEKGESLPDIVGESVLNAFKKAKAPSERASYAIALGLMKYEAAEKDLSAALQKTRDVTFRGYDCVALGLMGATAEKDAMTQLVMDSRRLPDLLRQAAIGLGLMNDHSVVDTLLELMKPADRSKSPPLAVLSAVATALGFIGDHRSVEPLVEMLDNKKDYTPLARAFAAVALGIVADKEILPWNSKIGEDLNYRAAVSTLVDQQSATGVLDLL